MTFSSVAALTGRPIRVKGNKESPYKFLLPDTLMGVEVEVDSDSANRSVYPIVDPTVWHRHHDGSLSHGYEYTLSRPLNGDDLGCAIQALFAPPSEFYRTFTGSTHIHMDMLEEEVTLDVLRTIVLLVYVLEPMLYEAGDATREWCGYSNSLKAASPLLLSTLFNQFDSDEFSRTYGRGGRIGRYYGLNLAALVDYGSLEFRYFPTATSPEELVEWINLVQSFKKAALEIGTPDRLVEIITNEDSYQSMLSEYFGEFNEVCAVVRNWKEAYSAVVKAQVISKDNQLSSSLRFDGHEIFAEGRFSSLVTLRNTGTTGAGRARIVNTGHVPTSVDPFDMLVYAGRVYVRSEDNTEWISVREDRYRFTDIFNPHAYPQYVYDGMHEIYDNPEIYELSSPERANLSHIITWRSTAVTLTDSEDFHSNITWTIPSY